MDALGIEKAHVVGHSMGAYTSLHVGIRHPERCFSVTAAGCGWGSLPDPAAREAMRALARRTRRCSPRRAWSRPRSIYADAPSRHSQKYKDPRGYAEFVRMLGGAFGAGPFADHGDAATQAADICGTWRRS